MNIICVVKFVPDVDNFTYDYEKQTINREQSTMMLNPDDAKAIGFAYLMKKKRPDITIEIVTMAPLSVTHLLLDILKVGVDKATLIADPLFAGSDTYATSKILSTYLAKTPYDVILTGTHAIDGDTSHVPSQIASRLHLDHLHHIKKIDEESFITSRCTVEVEDENAITTYEIDMPSLLSLTRDAPYRLPYVRYKNLHMDVTDRLTHISNKELGLSPLEVGLHGSKTRVVSTYTKKYEKRAKKVVGLDEKGIDEVYDFLKRNKFV